MCKDQFWSELFFHLKLSVHTSIHNSSPVYFTLVSAEHPPPFDQDHKPSLYDWLTQITQITHHKVISAFQNTFGLINTAPDYSLLQAEDWTGTATQVERKHYDPVILEFYWSISFF